MLEPQLTESQRNRIIKSLTDNPDCQAKVENARRAKLIIVFGLCGVCGATYTVSHRTKTVEDEFNMDFVLIKSSECVNCREIFKLNPTLYNWVAGVVNWHLILYAGKNEL